jgi:hypothetical protein
MDRLTAAALCRNSAIYLQFNYCVLPAKSWVRPFEQVDRIGEERFKMRTRALTYSLSFISATALAAAAGWLTYKHDFVVREGLGEQWSALRLMDEFPAKGRRPLDSDAAAFLSNNALDKALQQLVGATVDVPAEKVGGVSATIEDVRIQPGIEASISPTTGSPGARDQEMSTGQKIK